MATTERRPLPLHPGDRPWWTYQEVAERIGYSVDTVERLVNRGELRHVQLLPGKRGRRIAGSELARWERSRIEATAAEQGNQPEQPRRRGRLKHFPELSRR